MKVLITKPSPYQKEELQEYFQNQSWESCFIDSHKMLYQTLSVEKFDALLYHLNDADDFEIIRYINHNFPQTKVILTTNDRLYNKISNIQKCNFVVTSHLEDVCNINELFVDDKSNQSKPGLT